MRHNSTRMSGAQKALMAGGLGALAVAVGIPQASAATTLHLSHSPGNQELDLDGNTANGFDLVLYRGSMTSVSGWSYWLVRGVNNLSVAYESSIFRPHYSDPYGRVAHRFTNTTSIGTWGGGWGDVRVWDPYGGTGWSGYWDQGQGYIGFRVPDGGSGYNYGWVQITPSNGGYTLTIDAYSGSSSGSSGGGPSGAAGTPEPAASALGLLALGAAGVMRHKRRRKEQTA